MESQRVEYILQKGEGLTIEFKRAASALPKNPHIAKFFVQMARAEELGTGIRNVFKYSQLYSGDVPKVDEGDVLLCNSKQSKII